MNAAIRSGRSVDISPSYRAAPEQPSPWEGFLSVITQIDNAMLGGKNVVEFCRTWVVESMLGVKIRSASVAKTSILIAMAVMCLATVCMAQTDRETQQRLAKVEQRLTAQESEMANAKQRLTTEENKMRELKEEGGIAFFALFLFGLVLSIWAMNRQRSGCGWFILGFIPGINIIAGIVALLAESAHQDSEEHKE